MKLEDLKPGVYITTKHVTNPKPDRRKRDQRWKQDWVSWVTIPEGMCFIVDDAADLWDWDEQVMGKLPTWRRMRIQNFDGQYRDGLNWFSAANREMREKSGTSLFELMVDALKPTPQTLKVFLGNHGAEPHHCFSIVKSLIRHGRMTWAELELGITLSHEDSKVEKEDLPKPSADGAPRSI